MIGALIGVGVGACVTSWLHDHSEFWSQRLGYSRFRRANLPVGAVVGFLALGVFGWNSQLFGASIGMGLIAISWRYVDPLPGWTA